MLRLVALALALAGLLFFAADERAAAQAGAAPPVQIFRLGGVLWRVPAAFVTSWGRLGPAGPYEARLRFELPGFTRVNDADFKGVYPGDDKPILTVTISDDMSQAVGQPLLDQYMKQTVQHDCAGSCVVDSSIGGKVYTNYTFSNTAVPFPVPPTPFDVYVNSLPTGNWFAICPFRHDFAPLPCEVKERFGQNLIISYDFPREYMSQVFVLGAQLRILLAKMEDPAGLINPSDVKLLQPKPPCWSPAPGSPGAEIIPTYIGGELWQIPAADFPNPDTRVSPKTYARYDVFESYFKFNDLQPLTADDTSPFSLAGLGPYIDVIFSPTGRVPRTIAGQNARQADQLHNFEMLSTYVGQNGFVNYKEYLRPNNTKYLYTPGSYFLFISDEPIQGIGSVPGKIFTCTGFQPNESALCQFFAFRPALEPLSGSPNAGYEIQYSFSKDYFSQIENISECVDRLYRRFNGTDSGPG